LLSLKRLNRIRGLDQAGMTLTVEAGVTLAAAQEAAAEAGLLFPLTLASEGSCTIGGNISTNAGGNHVLRYGMMRALVTGLEVVLADGRVLPMLRSLFKDNSGYDLKQIFIGAEGTLGVITAAALRLFPRPAEVVTAFAAVPSPQAALGLLKQMQDQTGGLLSVFELIPRFALDLVLQHVPGTRDPLAEPSPWYVLMEVSGGAGGLEARTATGIEDAMADGLVTDAVVPQTEAQTRALWRLRETISEAQKREGASIKHDISVPVASIPEFIERASKAVEQVVPGARIVGFGHMGDGNLHFNISQPVGADGEAFLKRYGDVNKAVHDIVRALSGSISAEHGIGTLKRDELAATAPPVAIDLMRRIKEVFDPLGIMNPGKVL